MVFDKAKIILLNLVQGKREFMISSRQPSRKQTWASQSRNASALTDARSR